MSVDELTLIKETKRGLPDGYPDEPVYEVVDGLLVELPMSLETDLLANELTFQLETLVRPLQIGRVVHEVLFELPLTDRSRRRRPDVAFVSFARAPADQPVPHTGNAWLVAPDLAIEFISLNDEVEELMEKLPDYFDAGVRQVWIVHSATRLVQVYESLDLARGYREPAEIDGGTVLPGVRVPVSAMLLPR